jgi:hypothetical protein
MSMTLIPVTGTLAVPEAPPVVDGISPFANATPEDPFGFLHESSRGDLTLGSPVGIWRDSAQSRNCATCSIET